MQKFFNKNSPGIVSFMVVVALMGMLCPMAMINVLLPEAKPSPRDAMVKFVAPEPVEQITCLMPALSRELVFSYLARQGTGLFSLIDCSALFDKAQTCAAERSYFRNNDLNFNIPSFTYRQPLSEYSLEG